MQTPDYDELTKGGNSTNLDIALAGATSYILQKNGSGYKSLYDALTRNGWGIAEEQPNGLSSNEKLVVNPNTKMKAIINLSNGDKRPFQESNLDGFSSFMMGNNGGK